MCSLGTECAKMQLQRAPRTCVSLSDNLLIQLTYAVASLVPSRSQVGKIGINDGMRSGPSTRWGSRFLFERTIDTAGTDPNQLGNLLFMVSLSIQLPNPFMDTYTLAMMALTLLLSFLRDCSFDNRTCFSCTVVRCRFKHACVLSKKRLQGLGKMLL